LCLITVCLTRSLYHLYFLVLLLGIVCIYLRRREGANKLIILSFFAVVIVGGWYVKNYIIFKKFSSSTWMGMNLTRNVFHDVAVDSISITAIPPFSRITEYAPFIENDLADDFAGLNDKDLLQVYKNDTFNNLKHINYIQVSDKYLEACKSNIKQHPLTYMINVFQSAITYFAPATRYTLTEKQARKIKYYDLVYSFNVSHFAEGKQQRRIALVVSALPKILLYLFVFWILTRKVLRSRKLELLDIFIVLIIGYVFSVSSLVEHYENMRFRFETEPLFLILLAKSIQYFKTRKSNGMA
jgi:hypothetical protein